MRTYKLIIEAVFLNLGAEGGTYGCFVTLYIRAGNAIEASAKSRALLERKMSELSAKIRERGLFKTVFLIKDIWQVQNPSDIEQEQISDGSTLYPMGTLAKLMALARSLYVRMFRPHLILA